MPKRRIDSVVLKQQLPFRDSWFFGLRDILRKRKSPARRYEKRDDEGCICDFFDFFFLHCSIFHFSTFSRKSPFSNIQPLGDSEPEPNSDKRPGSAQKYRRNRKNTPSPKRGKVSAHDWSEKQSGHNESFGHNIYFCLMLFERDNFPNYILFRWIVASVDETCC